MASLPRARLQRRLLVALAVAAGFFATSRLADVVSHGAPPADVYVADAPPPPMPPDPPSPPPPPAPPGR